MSMTQARCAKSDDELALLAAKKQEKLAKAELRAAELAVNQQEQQWREQLQETERQFQTALETAQADAYNQSLAIAAAEIDETFPF